MSSPTEKSIWFMSHKQLFCVRNIWDTLCPFEDVWQTDIVCVELGVTQTCCILRPVPVIKRVPPSLYYTNVFRTVSVPCVKLKMSSEFPREEKRLSVCLQSNARFWFSFSVSARFIDRVALGSFGFHFAFRELVGKRKAISFVGSFEMWLYKSFQFSSLVLFNVSK